MRLFKMAVAIDQHHGFKPFSRSQRCKLQSFGHLDHTTILELSQKTSPFSHHSFEQEQESLEADNIHRSFSTPCLPLTTLSGELDSSAAAHHPRIEIVHGSGAAVHALVAEVATAMASGVRPKPLPSGLGGAYVLCNQSGKGIAVAKPVDEEPLALNTNSPKGSTGIRELAAYLLDHGGFAGVPPTALVKFCHATFFVSAGDDAPHGSSVASLQRFVGHGFDAGELGPSFFSVSSVHRIGILDVRLLNLDRHAGNMLVTKHAHSALVPGLADLAPIDHGFCLPECLGDPYFEWLHWPQASAPFSESESEYISKLDPLEDAEILRAEAPSLRGSSVRVLVVCTVFLKHAAAAALCLAEIGQMMTRGFSGGEETPSQLESICSRVKAFVAPHHHVSGDCRRCVSFGDLSQEEWESFLEAFNRLLPGMFEG